MKITQPVFLILAVVTAGTFIVGVAPGEHAFAQTFIQPPAAPPGGNSAGWITTGPLDERKLGSLLIGSALAPTPSSLCLNAADTSDGTKCISSWSDVVNLAGGPFVPLRTSGVLAVNQSDPTEYFTTPSATNVGAASIQATGPSQRYSLIAEANPDTNAGYGLFAGDGGVPGNYAAQFSGKVGIGNTILASGDPGPFGQLCLNNTYGLYDDTNPNKGVLGCIFAWGDLAVGSLTGFVRLQSANPPVADAGTAAASDVGNFATAVFGHPPIGQPDLIFCGDGMCSTNINEDVAGPNSCQIDCSAPNPPANFTVISTTTIGANLSLVGQAQLPAGNINVLVARSTNPSFINDLRSAFVPQNGVSYSKGQVINGVTIAEARQLSSPGYTFALSDTGLTTKTIYYYRLYQANLFPVYNMAPKTVIATTQ